jgi:hypothetical protein
MTQALLDLDWLAAEGVTHVAMESTGVYWKPVWNLLEGQFAILLVKRQHIKHVPGRVGHRAPRCVVLSMLRIWVCARRSIARRLHVDCTEASKGQLRGRPASAGWRFISIPVYSRSLVTQWACRQQGPSHRLWSTACRRFPNPRF